MACSDFQRDQIFEIRLIIKKQEIVCGNSQNDMIDLTSKSPVTTRSWQSEFLPQAERISLSGFLKYNTKQV